MHNGHYYFDKMPKEVQEEFKRAYDNCKGKHCELEEFLDGTYKSHERFIMASFYFEDAPQGDDYWFRIAKEDYSYLTYPIAPIEAPIKGDIAILYTLTDLVKFGNYLLSPARKVTHEENRGQVTDADLEWMELNQSELLTETKQD